jgi:hypothetical protein
MAIGLIPSIFATPMLALYGYIHFVLFTLKRSIQPGHINTRYNIIRQEGPQLPLRCPVFLWQLPLFLGAPVGIGGT